MDGNANDKKPLVKEMHRGGLECFPLMARGGAAGSHTSCVVVTAEAIDGTSGRGSEMESRERTS